MKYAKLPFELDHDEEVALLKIDVEGLEMAVLDGAGALLQGARRVGAILVEVSAVRWAERSPVGFEKAVELLERLTSDAGGYTARDEHPEAIAHKGQANKCSDEDELTEEQHWPPVDCAAVLTPIESIADARPKVRREDLAGIVRRIEGSHHDADILT